MVTLSTSSRPRSHSVLALANQLTTNHNLDVMGEQLGRQDGGGLSAAHESAMTWSEYSCNRRFKKEDRKRE